MKHEIERLVMQLESQEASLDERIKHEATLHEKAELRAELRTLHYVRAKLEGILERNGG